MALFKRELDSFSLAFEKYTDTVFRIAVHNTPSLQDAQDITQEVFLKLLQTSREFYTSEHLKAWLIRVTINLCRDELRKNGRTQLMDKPVKDEAVYDQSSVLEAVKALPENYRNAIYLHYYEGYKAKEIADILETKENTVLSWLSRGREVLRKEMIGGFDDE